MPTNHPVDSTTRTCCGGIGAHTRDCGPTALSKLSALELVDELLRRGFSVDALCSEVGASSMDELLHRLQPTK